MEKESAYQRIRYFVMLVFWFLQLPLLMGFLRL